MQLQLTSPHSRGATVRSAQSLLKQNRFGHDFLQGAVDGEFGPETKRAVKRAKYWLGWPEKAITGTYGWRLNDALTGKWKLRSHPLYALRAKRRQKAAKKVSLGVKAMSVALGQVGVKEFPAGSNHVKYNDWYPSSGPWCAVFVSWCLSHVGSRFHYAYVPSVVYDARHGRNGLQVVRDPKPGDLACFDWQGDGVADHIGFVVAVSGFAIQTVEGNTAVGNDSNGGEVMKRVRKKSQVQAFVRVGR